MIERFRDFYGCKATIIRRRNQTYSLTIRLDTGKLVYRNNYATYLGARIGMGKWSDSWEKTFE